MGCNIEGKDDANYTPIKIYGGDLKAIDYHMPVASAQVKSALILASLYANDTSFIYEKVKRDVYKRQAHSYRFVHLLDL